MSKKNMVLMIVSFVTLLIFVIGASFAYFGAFTNNVTNKTVVNSTTESAVTSSLITQAAVLNMTVPSNMMTKGDSSNPELAATANANLVITLNSGRTDIPVTCTYDIMYKNTGTYEYGVSPTLQVDPREFGFYVAPYNVSGVSGVINNLEAEGYDYSKLMLQDIANSSNKFAEGYGGVIEADYSAFAGSKTDPMQVSEGLITNCGYMLAEDTAYIENDDVPKLNLLSNNKKDYKVKFLLGDVVPHPHYTASESCQSNVTQTYNIGLVFSNIPNVDQSILAGKSFTGEFYVDNVSCNNDLYELVEEYGGGGK